MSTTQQPQFTLALNLTEVAAQQVRGFMQQEGIPPESGIAVANPRTLSPNERITMKTPEAARRGAGPKRDSRRADAGYCSPTKYPGSSHAATPMRPTRYPSAICRNVQSPRAASPGTELTVSADVSVATMESITAHHGRLRWPRK